MSNRKTSSSFAGKVISFFIAFSIGLIFVISFLACSSWEPELGIVTFILGWVIFIAFGFVLNL